MDLIEKLLIEISKDKKVFEPASNNKSDIEDFQSVAKALVFAHQEKLIEDILPHKESESGNDWYTIVVIQSGLSYKGSEYIKENHIASNESDFFILKPSFMGIGIDLKAASRWFLKKK